MAMKTSQFYIAKLPKETNCPILMLRDAILQGSIEKVDDVLKDYPKETQICLFSMRVPPTANRQDDLVSFGQLPMFIGALTGKTDLVLHILRLILNLANTSEEESTKRSDDILRVLTGKNKRDDNILHSVIKYAYLFPDEEKLMREMISVLLTDPIKEKTNVQLDIKTIRQRLLSDEDGDERNALLVAL